MLPTELILSIARTLYFSKEESKLGLRANIDLINEVKVQAYFRKLTYKRTTAKTFNARVHPHRVKEKDLVRRKAKVNDSTNTKSKLASTWE